MGKFLNFDIGNEMNIFLIGIQSVTEEILTCTVQDK
jgi:hypothetical protein